MNFLNYLDEVFKISITTRNQRLAAIKSFCRYIMYEDISNINNIQQILLIPMRKGETRQIDFLTKEELTLFLNSIFTNTRKGIRDYTLISLMYDSASRASEIINVKVNDLQLGNNPSITLYGKGKKYRTVPITEQTKELLIKYIKLEKLNSFSYLFSGNKNDKATSKMISHIIKKYNKLSNINKNIHPHSLRHTRAVHMLEAGIPLPYIRDILGHESITTTEIYAKISLETKRKALENVYINKDNFNKKESIWNNNEELLSSLLELD
jgi:integrase/recombinase XerD